MAQKSHDMFQDPTQILVEDHSQSEARFVDVTVKALYDFVQDYLDHQLEFVTRHLDPVEETFGPLDFVVDNSEASSRVPEVVNLFEPAFLVAVGHTVDSIVSLRHELIEVLERLHNFMDHRQLILHTLPVVRALRNREVLAVHF